MMLSNIETCSIKKVVLFFKIVTSFVLLRPFGKVLNLYWLRLISVLKRK